MKVPFYRLVLEEEDIKKVIDVPRSGWIGQGPLVEEFEREIKNLTGAGYAVALNSCTAGLFLSLKALNIGPGDEVITTPLTFAATVNVIENAGAKPVFADVDLETGNISPAEIEFRITPRTKAVIPVHLYGRPCDMDKIMKIAEKYNLKVIEDAAHAIGAKYRGRPIGSIGHITCFSFYATKNITTAEGGMLTTDDEELAEKVKILRLHGLSADAWKRHQKSSSAYYEVIAPGFKFNLTDMQAALGLSQLKRFGTIQRKRKRIWEKYKAFIQSELKGVRIPGDDGDITHAYHLFTIILERDDITRDELMKKLSEKGIGTSIHFRAVHLHPYYRQKYGYKGGEYPNAEHISSRTLSLPFFPEMKDEEIDYVCSALKEILR